MNQQRLTDLRLKLRLQLNIRRQVVLPTVSAWSSGGFFFFFQAPVELRTEAECWWGRVSGFTEAVGRWPPRSWWGRSRTDRWSYPRTSSRQSGWWGWWCRAPWSPARLRSPAQSRRERGSRAGPGLQSLWTKQKREQNILHYTSVLQFLADKCPFQPSRWQHCQNLLIFIYKPTHRYHQIFVMNRVTTDWVTDRLMPSQDSGTTHAQGFHWRRGSRAMTVEQWLYDQLGRM